MQNSKAKNTPEVNTTAADKSAISPPVTPNPESDPALRPKEIGGRKGPEPTRYGDWEKNGRCIDF